MLSRKLSRALALGGTIAMSLWAWIPTASSGSPPSIDDEATYAPVQSISYEFGSKSVSGYFVQQSATCVVTLMIAEKSEAQESRPLSPTRVRLMLYPDQIAGLDSEQGRSLNFTCGDGAATLLVNVGARDRLVELQTLALQRTIAQRH